MKPHCELEVYQLHQWCLTGVELTTNTPASFCFASLSFALLATLAVKLRFCLAAPDFQVCLWGSTGSEVLSRHRRAWIIASFEVEEEGQGPFPHQLGTVSSAASDSSANSCAVPQKKAAVMSH